jgi:hypothetical protein
VSLDPLGLTAGPNLSEYAPNPWGWVDPLGTSCKKAIVIGESMERNKKAVKDLRAKGIDATWYRAWGKNFDKNVFDLDKSLTRNERWLNKKMKEGYKIFDIGIDKAKPRRSDFYDLEKRLIKDFQDGGYPTIPLLGY